jgi:hypothetical protein
MDEKGRWVTVRGRRVFIKEGQTISEAIQEHESKKNQTTTKYYRGLTQKYDPNYDKSKLDNQNGYESWTDSKELAQEYAGKNGYVYSVEIPNKELNTDDIFDEEGERSLMYYNDKPVALHGIEGEEFMLYTDHEKWNELEYKLENDNEFKNYSVSREDKTSPYVVNYEIGKEKFDFPSNQYLDSYIQKGTDLPGREDYNSLQMTETIREVKKLAQPAPESFMVYAGIRESDELDKRKLISTSIQESTANMYAMRKGSEGITVPIQVEEGAKIISTFNSIDKGGVGDNIHFKNQGEIIIPVEGNRIIKNEDGSYTIKNDRYFGSQLTENDKGNKIVEFADGKTAEFLSKKEYKKISEDFANNLSDKELSIIQNYVDSPGYSGELNSALGDRPLVRYLHNNTDTNYFVSKNELNKYYQDIGESYEKEVGPLEDLRVSWPDEKSMEWAGKQLEEGASDSRKRDFLSSVYSKRKNKSWPDSENTYYSEEEIKEAKEIYSKMKPLCEERSKYNVMNPKWDEISSQISALTKDNKSEYYWKRIAELENDTVFDTRKYDFDKEFDSGNLTYKGAKELYDLRENKNPQSSDYYKNQNNITNTISEYKKLFEEKAITLDKDIVVFRRGRETEEQLKEGFTMYGLTSCTAFDSLPKKMPSGLHFGEQRDYIILPSGTKILLSEQVIGRGDDTGKHEDVYKGVRRQHEILLAPGTKFRRIKRTYNSEKDETDNLLVIEEGVNYYE